MHRVINLFQKTKGIDYKTEILSGLTVALALVPEAVAFALIAGLSPLVGLYAAFMMGLVTSLLGGRPGMISGATGALAVVIVSLAKTHGVEYIFATAVLTGIIQMLVGFLRLGKFIRLVPHPAIFGFVNGLAVIIFTSQLTQFKDDAGNWLHGHQLYVFGGLVLLSMLIIWGLPRVTKIIPASLAAILVVFALVVGFNIDTKTVGDIASIKGAFPPFHIPQIDYSLDTFFLILPYASIAAGVGIIESLLTLDIIDEITETRGFANKEAVAQGAANVLSGFFYGMGGGAMLGQSLINISNGARRRLSGVVASLMLLVFIMYGSSLIELVPMAALTGLMIMVAVGTFEWASLNTFNKMPRTDIVVMVLVTLVTIFLHNLALAVLVGVIISCVAYAWDSAKRIQAKSYVDKQGIKHYELSGPLFFASAASFAELFSVQEDPEHVIIDFAQSRVADMSAIEALNKLTERYAKNGKKLHLRHLSEDCQTLIKNAKNLIEVNILEDPRYKVMINDFTL